MRMAKSANLSLAFVIVVSRRSALHNTPIDVPQEATNTL